MFFLAFYMTYCLSLNHKIIDPSKSIKETTINLYRTDSILQNKIETIVHLRERVGRYNGEVVIIQGYYKINDGGGGPYAWDNTSLEKDDGGSIISPNGNNKGRWIGLFNDTSNSPKRFGAKSSNPSFDCTKQIQRYIDVLVNKGIKKIQLKDEFYIKQIRLSENHNGIEFGYGSLLKYEKKGTGENNEMILIKGFSNDITSIVIDSLHLSGFAQYTPNYQQTDDILNKRNGQWNNGISLAGTTRARIRNCVIRNTQIKRMGKSAISIDSCEDILIENISVTECSGHGIVASIRYGGFGPLGSWPVDFKPSVVVNNYFITKSRTVFDFAGTQHDAVIPNKATPYAKVEIKNIFAKHIDGRTKLGGWWSCTLSNIKFENDLLDNKQGYAAISISADYLPPVFISNFEVTGFSSALNGSAQLTSIEINGLNCKNCLYGVITGVNCKITNYKFEDGFAPIYGSARIDQKTIFSVRNFYFSKIRKNRFIKFKTLNEDYWKSVSIPSFPITSSNYFSFTLSEGQFNNFGEDDGLSFGYLHFITGNSGGKYLYQNILFKSPPEIKPFALIRLAGNNLLITDNINDSEGCTTSYSIVKEKYASLTIQNNLLTLQNSKLK